MDMDILYEDDDILVVKKPAGVDAQAGRTFSQDMVSLLMTKLKKEHPNQEPYIGVVHRLDKPVSGLMVYAKTKQAAKNLSAQMADSENSHMDKVYLALVWGKTDKKQDTLVDNLYFDRKTNTSYVVEENSPALQKKEAKKAILIYELMDQQYTDLFEKNKEIALNWRKSNNLGVEINDIQNEPISLLKIKLKTGRHHQIRVQLSHRGLPIVGDTRYDQNLKTYRGQAHLCLCAYELSFIHPRTKKKMHFCLL